jgi:F-type H+-transporting ATPase subunit b
MRILTDPELWIALAWLIALFILLRKAVPGILAALDARGVQIRTQLDEAKQLREEAEAMLAEYQRKQRDALAEAKEIIAHAQADAERIAAEAAAELDALLKRREHQAIERIARLEADALGEVRAIAADIALEATRRVLKESLDWNRSSGLIDDAITQMPARLN